MHLYNTATTTKQPVDIKALAGCRGSGQNPNSPALQAQSLEAGNALQNTQTNTLICNKQESRASKQRS